MVVVDEDKGHGGLAGQGLFVGTHLGLDPAGAEGPEVGGLLDIVILLQAFGHTRNVGQVGIHVQSVGGAGADFSVGGHEHKKGGNRTGVHGLPSNRKNVRL